MLEQAEIDRLVMEWELGLCHHVRSVVKHAREHSEERDLFFMTLNVGECDGGPLQVYGLLEGKDIANEDAVQALIVCMTKQFSDQFKADRYSKLSEDEKRCLGPRGKIVRFSMPGRDLR